MLPIVISDCTVIANKWSVMHAVAAMAEIRPLFMVPLSPHMS
jgi:hypothetical protein